MKKSLTLSLTLSILMLGQSLGQDSPAPAAEDAKQRAAELTEAAKQRAADLAEAAKQRAAEATEAARAKATEVSGQIKDKAGEMSDLAKEKATAFAESEEGKQASATVLEWIQSAESLYTPWMNWALVAVGIALFVSHAGQLLLGKLWALIRGKGFSFCEFCNDFLVAAFAGLSLPVVLLIPTGSGAFISNPLQVLSAAAVGMILGVILYTHGMNQEMQAAQERIDQDEAEEA